MRAEWLTLSGLLQDMLTFRQSPPTPTNGLTVHVPSCKINAADKVEFVPYRIWTAGNTLSTVAQFRLGSPRLGSNTLRNVLEKLPARLWTVSLSKSLLIW